ncbi:ribonuclease R [Emticicia oligotrophica DSM 17448]|uniref:Ribonuclease R n=1 Tax=Emticicia oligotrophica (strain DSM 17448 / CIP 109782 / MTCC 6937 / GPTSA100-15) TaxID=929562 RepID=A0ABN4AMQ4_EMTOG|nr:ribonuclease R [Emticicia oligotrophica]AFK03627.1 ribonuclease R [Emticicia oligotrophica DSM 17448]
MTKNKQKSYYDQMKAEILAFFSVNSEHPYTLQDLFSHYDVKNKQEKALYGMLLEDLLEEGKIYQIDKGKYTVDVNANSVVGRLDHVNPRFGFIRYDETKPDIWVSADDMKGAIDGDLVKATVYGEFYRKGDNPEGAIIEIIERGRKEIVGKIQTFGNYALVHPDHKNLHDDIFVPKDKIKGATKDDLVIVRILTYPTNVQQGTGEVIEILGKSGENNAEMHAILAEFGLPIRFDKAIEEEAAAISEVITEEEIKKRRDFRNILTFTIDPHDAKDFDDALSFRVLENHNFEIGVHIADVTHYVREGTRLEEEAYNRATSVYLVDRTIPMLPEKLSNNLCSLRPNEDKLTFSAVFEMTHDGRVISEWFGRTIIHSDKRFTYEEAQEVLENEEGDVLNPITEPNEILEKYRFPLHTLNHLAKILKKERFRNGAINFETNEVKFKLDETGKPLGVVLKIRKDAHKLIEEFMLLANKKVAEFVFKLGGKKQGKQSEESQTQHSTTMVYRVHEPPNPEKLQNFANFAGRFGFSIRTDSDKSLSNSMNKMMSEVEGTPVQNVLEQLAVRTMSKARYTTESLGHFGLAFDHYSHFTSPIRRYPDMMAHRLLHHYLTASPKDFGNVSRDEFEKKSKHSSDREKLAAEAERASIKYKQVEFMSLQDRKTVFSGVVTGVTDFGIFVEITTTNCEGMVRLADLKDDYYEWDRDNYRVVGKRTGRVINFGDTVKVIVKGTDLDRRSMDLELVGLEGKTMPSSNTRRSNRGQRDAVSAKSGPRKRERTAPKRQKSADKNKGKRRKK